MRRKLDGGEYAGAADFKADFDLMIKNCMLFNPAGTPVHVAGVELRKLFNEKWANLPPLKLSVSEDEDDDIEDNDSEEERERELRFCIMTFVCSFCICILGNIAQIESQIEALKGNLEILKNGARKKDKKKKKEVKKRATPPIASSSKANGKEPKRVSSSKKQSSTKKNGGVFNSDVLSFEQKKDLSETIQTLDGEKLERVIQIIHDGVPEVRDVSLRCSVPPPSILTRGPPQSTEEIELDIDQLPGPVLQKLYNFVILPLRQTGPKRKRTGTGTGTGGLKRKSMDEDVEAEKIRQLEERMRMFDNKSSGAPMDTRMHDDSEHSSVDSSDDSSGSD